jgi:hypothetical protein
MLAEEHVECEVFTAIHVSSYVCMMGLLILARHCQTVLCGHFSGYHFSVLTRTDCTSTAQLRNFKHELRNQMVHSLSER